MPPRFDLRRCAILAVVLVWLATPLTVRAATPAPSAPTGCPADVVTLETLTLDTILDTPEPSRADCFGGQELTFTAAGYAITNTWPGISLPPVLLHDWMLRADRHEDELIVSVPDTVALPDPSGTPWANRDTVGTSATWWLVTGHFDDAAAGDCRPDPDDVVDGIPVEMTPAEVRTFCRNRLVVDRLVWLPSVDPAGSPLAVKATPVAEGPPIEQGPSIEQAPRRSDADVGSAPILAIAVVVGLSILVFVIAAFASTRTRHSR